MKDKLRESMKIFCISLAYTISGESCWIFRGNCKFKAWNKPKILMGSKEIMSNGIWKHV